MCFLNDVFYCMLHRYTVVKWMDGGIDGWMDEM